MPPKVPPRWQWVPTLDRSGDSDFAHPFIFEECRGEDGIACGSPLAGIRQRCPAASIVATESQTANEMPDSHGVHHVKGGSYPSGFVVGLRFPCIHREGEVEGWGLWTEFSAIIPRLAPRIRARALRRSNISS